MTTSTNQPYSLFIDDLRIAEQYYNGTIITVRSYQEGVDYVLKHGLPKFVSFDHDLGDTNIPEKTGYDFAKFLIDYIIDHDRTLRFDYHVHSANPVGKINIECYLDNAFIFLK